LAERDDRPGLLQGPGIEKAGARPVRRPRPGVTARGEQVARSLPNTRHVVVPAAGHMTSLTGCVPRLIEEFLATADTSAVNTSCLEGLHRPPFVTSRAEGLNP
jgi:hypothetical protein